MTLLMTLFIPLLMPLFMPLFIPLFMTLFSSSNTATPGLPWMLSRNNPFDKGVLL